MFIRFVIHDLDDGSGKRQGLFHAMWDLRDKGELYPHEEKMYDSVRGWFNAYLDKPLSFSRSRKPHAHHEAISWFRDSATVHIAKMYQFASILESHGYNVEVIRTERPGYIVYEDKYQIAATPFNETRT